MIEYVIFPCLAITEKELYPELLFFLNCFFLNFLNIVSEENVLM